MFRQPLLIVGASGRAAAASARRAGFEPFVLDLFADADTERLCPVLKLPVAEYPHGFVELAKRVPPMPWMYTGGLENYPDVVAAISEARELWGNGPEVLKRIRDPIELHIVLSGKGLEHPRLYRKGEPETVARWLRKPMKGAAGGSIRFATPVDLESTGNPNIYLQEYMDGSPMSAVAKASAPNGIVIGVTRQIIGAPWLHARPFQYAGNIIGGDDDERIRHETVLHQFRVNDQFKMSGVWGFDFIWKDSRPYLIEVNPRYPASAELFEHAMREPIFEMECRSAFGRSFAKAIYYAPHRIVFPTSGPWDESLAHCADVWRRPDFADIPHADDVVEMGQPVLTIFAEAPDEKECEAKLKARAAELDRLFAVG